MTAPSPPAGENDGIDARVALALAKIHIMTAITMWRQTYGNAPCGVVVFDLTSAVATALADQYVPAPVRELVNHGEFFGTVMALAQVQDLAANCQGDELRSWCGTTHNDGLIPCLVMVDEVIVSLQITYRGIGGLGVSPRDGVLGVSPRDGGPRETDTLAAGSGGAPSPAVNAPGGSA